MTRASPTEEVVRLRGCLSDLASILSLPALKTGSEPAHIAHSLLDALLGTLGLAFVSVRLNDPENGLPLEVTRVAESLQGTAGTREISQAIDSSLGAMPLHWPSRARLSFGNIDLAVASVRLGHHGALGVIIAGSLQSDFPAHTDELVLDVAASQAAIGLQEAGRLGESERYSRLLLDNIPGMVALLTATGEVELVNRQLMDYFGQTLEELKHWGTNGSVHSDDLPHVVDIFVPSIASGTPYEIVQRFRRSDGSYRWFENRGFPVRDRDGSIARWCVLLTDIDDRKRAEDAVQASEHNLNLTINTIPVLAWSTLPDGSADFFNQYFLEYTGLAADEASGWGWTVALHPDDRDGLAATWLRLLATEEPGDAEARLRRHDGEYRWFLFRANPLRDETGRVIRWYGVNIDIEDRKRAEVELRRAYDSFAQAQRLSKTGNFTADIVVDEHIWSDELYRIFEFEPGMKITVQAVRDVIHPDDLPSFDAGFARSLGGVDFDQVFRIVTASQNVKHLHSVGYFIERVVGRPLFIGAIQDVTERMVAEEALTRARAELAHVARVTTLSALTASIAHEVNQPLSGIITNASTGLRMLDADPPDVEGARETVRRTLRDGNRASDVITRLRALFTKKELALEQLDLNEATREVIALLASEIQQNRVVLQVELSDGLPPVTGDRTQLQQVILNLVRNASEAMIDVRDRPRQLLIETEREDDDHVRLTIRDTGVGLPPEGLNSLFDPFHTTKSDGMGIGLFVSASIIHRHQGRLWAESNDDAPGATFSFSIPYAVETIPGEPLN